MKYEIDFNDTCADLFFREIYFAFERCEKSFRDRDLEQNISNAVAFQTALRGTVTGSTFKMEQTGSDKSCGFCMRGSSKIFHLSGSCFVSIMTTSGEQPRGIFSEC